jgi:hypothetical protein
MILFLVILFNISPISSVYATIRIMPLGDSITQGTSSGEPLIDRQVSYRKALWDKLFAAGDDVDFVGSRNSGSEIFGDIDLADHEGHPGWRDDEILNGRISAPEEGKLIEWLLTHQPDIILVHIGTNGLDPSPEDVEAILNVVDFYSQDVWVILPRIINRSCITDVTPCSESETTTQFNDNVMTMAQNRIDILGDKIILVNMETGADIDYHLYPAGDMFNNYHPYETGYEKMADVWFSALEPILPLVDGTDAILDYIEIEGPSVINENSRADYNCRAYYTNGTDRQVMADTWDEDSAYAAISNTGHLTTTEVLSNEPVQVFASYTEGGVTTNTTYDVLVKNTNTQSLTSRESQPGSVSQGEWAYYKIEASALNAEIMVELTGLSANVDLYVLSDFQPTLTDYDCVSYNSGTTSETCILENSGATTWYIGAYGNNGGSFTINAKLSIFDDVSLNHWAEEAIYKIYVDGITQGCCQTPLKFCPDVVTNREQMAVFLGRGIHGSDFIPPEATGIFDDVPLDHWAVDWIEQVYTDGITQGCSTDPLRYCPEVNVTRAQMAVFLLRAKHGGSYTPPGASGIFSDVDLNHWAADWIEELYNEGITMGCGTDPLRYCPDISVTRAQMAVFLVRSFGL